MKTQLEVGKCYSIRAFESQWFYKIEVYEIRPTGLVFANYRTRITKDNKKHRSYKYMSIQNGGCFSEIKLIRKIKSL